MIASDAASVRSKFKSSRAERRRLEPTTSIKGKLANFEAVEADIQKVSSATRARSLSLCAHTWRAACEVGDGGSRVWCSSQRDLKTLLWNSAMRRKKITKTSHANDAIKPPRHAHWMCVWELAGCSPRMLWCDEKYKFRTISIASAFECASLDVRNAEAHVRSYFQQSSFMHKVGECLAGNGRRARWWLGRLDIIVALVSGELRRLRRDGRIFLSSPFFLLLQDDLLLLLEAGLARAHLQSRENQSLF